MADTILTRVGRIIAGLSNAALDSLERRDPVAHGEQALRDIDGVIEEARAELGRHQAEQYRIESRRGQLVRDLDTLGSRIASALAGSREDLARSGIARQMDLEAQMGALDALSHEVGERIGSATSALKAAGAARQDAQTRLDLLRQSAAVQSAAGQAGRGAVPGRPAGPDLGALDGPLRTIERVTSLPGGASGDVMELEALHRDREIEARLAAMKGGVPRRLQDRSEP